MRDLKREKNIIWLKISIKYLNALRTKKWCANFHLSKAEKFSFSFSKFTLNSSGDQRFRWQLLYIEVEGSSSLLHPMLRHKQATTHVLSKFWCPFIINILEASNENKTNHLKMKINKTTTQ